MKHEAFKESAKVVERCIIITPAAASEEEASIFFLFEERWCEGGKDISLSLSSPLFGSLSRPQLLISFLPPPLDERERESDMCVSICARISV